MSYFHKDNFVGSSTVENELEVSKTGAGKPGRSYLRRSHQSYCEGERCKGCEASGRFSAPLCMRYRARAVGGGEAGGRADTLDSDLHNCMDNAALH